MRGLRPFAALGVNGFAIQKRRENDPAAPVIFLRFWFLEKPIDARRARP